MEKADSLLGPLLRNLGIEEGVRLARLKNDWHRIIGKPISVHTSPSRLSEGELLLNADSPIWIHQLSFCKAAIIEKLGVYGVRDVRFRIGKIPQKKHEQHAQSPGELSSDDALFIAELTSGIGDEELKKVVKGAAEKSFRTRGRK